MKEKILHEKERMKEGEEDNDFCPGEDKWKMR